MSDRIRTRISLARNQHERLLRAADVLGLDTATVIEDLTNLYLERYLDIAQAAIDQRATARAAELKQAKQAQE